VTGLLKGSLKAPKSEIMPFTKGDILLPSRAVTKADSLNGLYHPAVVWDDSYNGNADFSGIMLTHSPPNGRFTNILMALDHFEKGYRIGFTSTHFLNQVFIKFQNWGPFELVGRLTVNGVTFIESNLHSNSSPLEFAVYDATQRKKW